MLGVNAFCTHFFSLIIPKIILINCAKEPLVLGGIIAKSFGKFLSLWLVCLSKHSILQLWWEKKGDKKSVKIIIIHLSQWYQYSIVINNNHCTKGRVFIV